MYVVVHVAVALDGATTGFPADVGRFYELARRWEEDVTLTGADTVLVQEEALRAAPGPGPSEGAPLLAVVDGRGRVRAWAALRDAGYWSGVVALHCEATPSRPPGRDVDEIDEIVVGTDRVDLAAALEALGQRAGVETVRVDSGGGLTGALLRQGLVDEVSLLVHPSWSDGTGRPWHGSSAAPPAELDLVGAETLGELVWLRYRFRR